MTKENTAAPCGRLQIVAKEVGAAVPPAVVKPLTAAIFKEILDTLQNRQPSPREWVIPGWLGQAIKDESQNTNDQEA